MHQVVQKIRTKHTLYCVCFMALSFIEYLRATAVGNIWSAAANCTGLVMMVIVFSALPLGDFLRPLYYVYSGLCAAALPLVYLYWTRHKGEFYLGQIETAVLNIWWLGLAVHYLWEQIFVKKRIKLKFGITGGLWTALTAWTVVSVAGRWWPLWFFLMFGVFYLVEYRREDMTALMDGMIDGTILSFFLIQGWAYLFRPYDDVRYRGAFSNCNMMALYYLIVYCMVLIKLHLLYTRQAEWGRKLFYFIGAGTLLGFQFLTLCRTAWVTAAVLTVFYGVLVLRGCRGERWGRILLRGCALVLCMALVFPAVFWTVRWLPTIHPHPVWYDGEWNVNKVHSWDPADSGKYVEWDEFWDKVLRRIDSTLHAANSRNPLVLRVHAQGDREVYMDDYSWMNNSMSIRIMYYKLYLKYAAWFGNPADRGIVFPEKGLRSWHAQNLWIQLTYSFGYPAGVLSLLLTAAVIVRACRRCRAGGREPYAVIPFLVMTVYFVFGITEIVWNPGQLILTMMFLVQHPQVS